MADDNLLWAAGASGFFQGLSSTLVPLLQDKYKQERELQSKLKLIEAEKQAKQVIPSPYLRQNLNIPADVTTMSPEELDVAKVIAANKLNRSKQLISEERAYEMERQGKLTPGVDYEVFGKKTAQTAEEKAAVKKKGMRAKALGGVRNAISELNAMERDIDDLLTDPALGWATGMASPLSSIPGTPSKDVAAKLESLKAKSGFSKLQKMRQDSPTGGSLGNVSDTEVRLLQHSAAALDAGQRTKSFIKTLEQFKNDIKNTKLLTRDAYEIDFEEPYPYEIEYEKKEDNQPLVKQEDLQVGKSFGGGKIKAVRWK